MLFAYLLSVCLDNLPGFISIKWTAMSKIKLKHILLDANQMKTIFSLYALVDLCFINCEFCSEIDWKSLPSNDRIKNFTYQANYWTSETEHLLHLLPGLKTLSLLHTYQPFKEFIHLLAPSLENLSIIRCNYKPSKKGM